MNKSIFSIEHWNGNDYLSFELQINDDYSIEIKRTNNCSLADIDGDYIFNTNSKLYRIQADDNVCLEDLEGELYD